MKERKYYRDVWKETKLQTREKKKVSYRKVGTLPSVISQSHAKTCLLPNAAIWRDSKRGAWCCHTKPYKRIRELWDNMAVINKLL